MMAVRRDVVALGARGHEFFRTLDILFRVQGILQRCSEAHVRRLVGECATRGCAGGGRSLALATARMPRNCTNTTLTIYPHGLLIRVQLQNIEYIRCVFVR